ncbi:MAG: alanyl-tRNA editing protein [Clostridia bacterium]|nr:alanyl-tRNA editing protein [Clostridia bacterium]
MSERIYENDSYIMNFTATVLSCKENGEYFDIILDRTAFFPEGGGQQGDNGFIESVCVADTQLVDGKIVHKAMAPVEEGIEVECFIDWETRYDRMQNHTGEHILSGIIHDMYGYNNVGFHMNDDEVTFDVDGKLTEEDIYIIEITANKIIDDNHPISVIYPEGNELVELDYRSKLDLTEGVRIVNIEGVDLCACCAPHVATTSEVGLIKITRFYSNKGGTRLHVLCGGRARGDYGILSEQVTYVTNAASSKRYELNLVYDRLLSEIASLKEEHRNFKASVINEKVEEAKEGKGGYLYFVKDFTFDDLVKLCDVSTKKYTDAMSCVFCGNDDEGYNFVIGGEGSAQKFPEFRREFNARGGGRDMYQGKVQAKKSDIEKFFYID